jgi:hypothetical protein
MKTIYYSVVLVSFLGALLFSSCKSVNKLYQKGDYDEAVYTAVKKLQKNKLKDGTKELVADAYAKAIRQREANIDNLKQRNDELRWEAIVYEYEHMQGLSDAINRSPEALQYVRPVNFNNALAEARSQAADIRYSRGLRFMNYGDKQNARNAWNEFAIANRYKPGSEVQEQLRRAYDAAATYVVLAPVTARYYNMSDYARSLERDLLSNLQNSSPSQFVRFYSAWDAQRMNLKADHVIELRYNDIRRGDVNRDRSERDLVKENVLLREVYVRPDSVVREYGRVTGKMTKVKETVNSEGSLYMTVRDANNGYVVVDRRVESNYCWANEYATFTGDERVLTNEDRTLLNNSRNQNNNQPDERQLLSSLTRDIYNRVCGELRDFYSRL